MHSRGKSHPANPTEENSVGELVIKLEAAKMNILRPSKKARSKKSEKSPTSSKNSSAGSQAGFGTNLKLLEVQAEMMMKVENSVMENAALAKIVTEHKKN